MKNNLKGCLLMLFLFVLGVVIVVYLFNNKIDNDFKKDRKPIEDSWQQYKSTIYYRDSVLFQDSTHKNLFPILQLTENNLRSNGDIKELLNNEFAVNDSLLRNKNLNGINKKLNDILLIYNSNVKQFNVRYSIFPYSSLRRKKGISLYDYFNIEYGKNNDEIKRKQKEMEDWIKYGGKLKEE